MKIKKAVITAAGYGTRSFPLTKTIQKEMIPILNRPLIDYAVDDLIEAGVEEVIFVVKPGPNQLRNFYTEDLDVKKYLQKMGKMDKYPELEKLHTKARFTFVEQKPSDPYGTATPLKLVKEHVENEEAFFVYMGDNFIRNLDGSSEAADMKKVFSESNAESLTSFIPMPKEVLYKYGIAKTREENGYDYLVEIIEKPKPGEEPSDLVNLSRYIFTPSIYKILDEQQINPDHSELLITDTLSVQASNSNVVVHSSKAMYLDGGILGDWLKANLLLASEDAELYDSLLSYMQELKK